MKHPRGELRSATGQHPDDRGPDDRGPDDRGPDDRGPDDEEHEESTGPSARVVRIEQASKCEGPEQSHHADTDAQGRRLSPGLVVLCTVRMCCWGSAR